MREISEEHEHEHDDDVQYSMIPSWESDVYSPLALAARSTLSYSLCTTRGITHIYNCKLATHLVIFNKLNRAVVELSAGVEVVDCIVDWTAGKRWSFFTVDFKLPPPFGSSDNLCHISVSDTEVIGNAHT